MGSEVNLIFRLEKLASSIGERCALSEAAHMKLGELVPVRSLGEFDLPQLIAMIAAFDAESVALLESYLDRRFPAWRQNAQGDTAGGQRRAAPGGKMTDEEAYQILGLQPGAGRDDISRAHRALMKKLHPDQGGSTYLAARVNEAKDTLLRTHL